MGRWTLVLRHSEASSTLFHHYGEGQHEALFPKGNQAGRSRMTASGHCDATAKYKLQNILSRGLIRSCPVESRHVQFADDIYGKNLDAVKGKIVRRVVKLAALPMDPVPEDIFSRYPNVTLSIDIMFVNAVPFLVAISTDLKIGHALLVTSRHDTEISQALKRFIARYDRHGFSQVRADEEFYKLEGLVNVDFDFAATDDHEPVIEQFIRTIKDSCRSQYNILPFRYIPRLLSDILS
jgi:hypothetical protein